MGVDEVNLVMYWTQGNNQLRSVSIANLAPSPESDIAVPVVNLFSIGSSIHLHVPTQTFYFKANNFIHIFSLVSRQLTSVLTGFFQGTANGMCFDQSNSVLYHPRNNVLHQTFLIPGPKMDIYSQNTGPILGATLTANGGGLLQLLWCDTANSQMWIFDGGLAQIVRVAFPTTLHLITTRQSIALGPSLTPPSSGYFGMEWGDPLKTFFWAVDPDTQQIARVNPTNPSLSSYLATGSFAFQDPRDLVFDSANNQLFVTDAKGMSLVRIPLSAPATAAVVDVGLYDWAKPIGITIDPQRGFLYVVDNGNCGIVQVPIATPELARRVNNGLQYFVDPTAITMDVTNNHLYIIDHTMLSVNNAGQGGNFGCVARLSMTLPAEIACLQPTFGLVFGIYFDPLVSKLFMHAPTQEAIVIMKVRSDGWTDQDTMRYPFHEVRIDAMQCVRVESSWEETERK